MNQCFHHNQRQHRHDDDHNHQNTDGRNHTGHSAEFLFHNIAQRLTVTAHGHEQDHHVLYRAGKHHAEDNPQRARQIAHLRRQHRADQWTCARNRGKVVAKQNAFVCRHIVQAVVVPLGGREAVRVKLHHIFGDVETVIAVGDGIHRNGGRNHPDGADLFAAADGKGDE